MKHLFLSNHHYQKLLEGFANFLAARGYSRSTCHNLPRHVREFLCYLEKQGRASLSQVGRAETQGFLQALQARPHYREGGNLSAAYLNKYLQALKRFAEYCQQMHQLPLSVSFPAFKQKPGPKTVLSPEEIQALYASCGRDALGLRDRAMLSLYYGCGLRRKEGEGLDLEDVQLEQNRIYVKAGKNGQGRWVPLLGRVKQDLAQYREQGRPRLQSYQESQAFLLRCPGQRVGSQSLALRLKQLLLKSQVGQDAGLHSLRHSIATHLWEAGMPLVQVSRFLGHRSLESTQIYTHLRHGQF